MSVVYNGEQLTLNDIGERSESIGPFAAFILSESLGIPRVAAEQTVVAHLSQWEVNELTESVLRRLVWLFLANFDHLIQGHVLPPFVHPLKEEWQPVVVYDIRPDVNRYKKSGYTLGLQFLGGPGATSKFGSFFTNGGIFFLKAQAGIQRRVFPFFPRELVGFRYWVLLDPKSPGVSFKAIDCDHPFKRFNRKLTKDRRTNCLVEPGRLCVHCPLGRDQCSRAVHSETYEVRTCPACEEENAWFRAGQERYCVDCQTSRYLRGRHKAAEKGILD